MDLVELQRKLIANARANPPGDHVPYAFEKRIMSRLTGRPLADSWQFWERGLARAAGLCVAAMLGITAWSFAARSASQEPLSQAVETTLFAAVDNPAAPDSAAESR
jgi:hypothetical protein